MMTVCGTMFAQTNNYFKASFTNATIKFDAMGLSFKENLNGVSVGVAQEHSLPVSLPLSYEYGANLMAVFGDGSTLISAIVPINLMYTIDLDQIQLIPFAGLNLTGHIIGQTKEYGETDNWFKGDEEGGAYNRFQLGAQFGAKAKYEKYIFGISYQPSVTKLADYTNLNMFSVSVGILF